MITQLLRCLGILAEWFLDDDTTPASVKRNRYYYFMTAPLSYSEVVDTYFWPMHVSLIKRVTDSNTDGGNAK